MQELIINYETDQPTVSARDLYEGLEIKERFSLWISRVKSNFEEGELTRVGKPTVVNNGAERILDDYLVSIDNAKHICLMCKTDKGRRYRQYFLDLEKAWNTPEQIMARALKMANEKLDSLKNQNMLLLEDVQRMKPKEIFADAVAVSHTTILIGELAKLLKQNGMDIGQNKLFVWLRENGYLCKRNGTDYNMPTQKSMELELFEILERTITNPDGSIRVTKTTKVTGKGQQYFITKFLSNKQFVGRR